MSEWNGVVRLYGPLQGFVDATGWDLIHAGEIIGSQYADSLSDAQEACDTAAVAWFLIALAKRAAAWAEGIDARLAREYRAVSRAYEQATHVEPWDEAAWDEAFRVGEAVQEAHAALLRGWP